MKKGRKREETEKIWMEVVESKKMKKIIKIIWQKKWQKSQKSALKKERKRLKMTKKKPGMKRKRWKWKKIEGLGFLWYIIHKSSELLTLPEY